MSDNVTRSGAKTAGNMLKKSGRPKAGTHERAPKICFERGPLHRVLTEKLPDLRGAGGVCNLRRLATELNMTYQGVYKWMRPGRKHRLPFDQVKRIVALSERQTLATLSEEERAKWRPAIEADFFEYIV